MHTGRFQIAAFFLAATLTANAEVGRAVAPRPDTFDDGTAKSEILDQIRLSPFRFERMTLSVSIKSGPPLTFLIDTGAEISGVTPEVARKYGLMPSGSRTVVGIAGREQVKTVHMSGLHVAQLDSSDGDALLFSRQSMGADGYLGIDSLADKRIEFDFANHRMRMKRSSRVPMRATMGSTVLQTGEQNGRLIFSTARVNKTNAMVILDTGSTITLGNSELMHQLAAKGRLGETIPIVVQSISGKKITVEYAILREVRVGDIMIRRLPIAFLTAEPFHHLGLDHRPALLLGMDALRAFASVTVDFRNRAVMFVGRDDGEASIKLGSW